MMAEEQDHEGLVGASGGEGDTVGDYAIARVMRVTHVTCVAWNRKL